MHRFGQQEKKIKTIEELTEYLTSVLEDLGELRDSRTPLFLISKSTDEELKLADVQKPILEKLDELGFGVYIEKDLYLPIPMFFKDDHFPVDLYDSHIDGKITVQNWNELTKLATHSR